MIVAALASDEVAISFKSPNPYTPRLFAESWPVPFDPIAPSAALG
jgi:ABC-type transport system substrate-binding protein